MPSAPAAPKKPRPVAADSGIRSVYGFDITADQARSREFMFALELKCYRENWSVEGGLGAEQHFKKNGSASLGTSAPQKLFQRPMPRCSITMPTRSRR